MRCYPIPINALCAVLIFFAASLGSLLSATSVQAVTPAVVEPAATAREQPRRDLYGDLLPEGAMARLGTRRFRDGLFMPQVAFSPDGKTLASGDYNGRLVLWDANNGKLLRRFDVTRGIGSLAFTPDGNALIASGGPTVFDVRTGKEMRRFEFQSRFRCFQVVLTSDGSKLATNAGDQVLIFDVRSGRILFHFLPGAGTANTLAFSADGKLLVAGTTSGTLLCWDTASGKELRRWQYREASVWRVAFSRAGKLLASADDKGFVCVRDFVTDREQACWQASKQRVAALAFAPDDTLLASSGWDGVARLWEPRTGKPIRQWRASVSSIHSMAFAPDGKRLATAGSFDHAIRIWDPMTGKPLHPVHGHTGDVRIVQYSKDGKTLLSWSEDKSVVVWDVATAQERQRLFGGLANGRNVEQFALSPDGKRLAMTYYSADGNDSATVHAWETATGKELPSFKHGSRVYTLAFSPDGSLLASGDRDGRICIRDPATGKESPVMPKVEAPVGSLTFSPDGKSLVSSDGKGFTRLWNIATAKELRSWQRGFTYSITFSPDGRQLAFLNGRKVHVWAMPEGDSVRNLGSARYGHDVAFSGSGRLLAVTEWQENRPEREQEVHLWEVFSGQEVRRVVVPDAAIWCLALSPDGSQLATGSTASDIVLWDLTGRRNARGGRPDRLTEAELGRLWTAIAGEARPAYPAMWALVGTPEQAVRMLRERVHPVVPADPQRVTRVISNLDSAGFDMRQRAMRELKQLGELAQPQLRAVRDGQPTPEIRQRVDQLLNNLNSPVTDPEQLRALRAVDVLEQIATPEARVLLRSLAEGAPAARLTRESQASLDRLNRRTPALP